MRKRFLCIGLMLLYVSITFAQDQFKLMTYNLLEFPEAPPDNRQLILNDILAEVDPDLLLVQELQSPAGADLINDFSFNYTTKDFQSADFVFNTSGGNNLNQLLFYNADLFEILTTDQIGTSLRDINYYKLRLKTVNETTLPVDLHVFIAHLKASQGDFNEQWRFDMVQEFTDFLFTLPADARVIFGGDMNFYSGNESAVQQLIIGNTPIPVFDPMDQIGDWHTNSSFADIHTQSTRQNNNTFDDFGAGGGLDDRFDFIFLSDNLLDDTSTVYYQTDTYQSVGNNGNCYNDNINASSCFGDFDQSLRDDLYNMSDHLPVVITMKTTVDFLTAESYQLDSLITFPNGNIGEEVILIKYADQLVNRNQNIQIYNNLGKLIKNSRIDQKVQVFNVSGWNSGIYFLKIASYPDVVKFIVN